MSRDYMKKNDIDNLEDLFRSKLQDFEAETAPGDWEAIEKRLPSARIVPFYRTFRFRAAAAVIALLLIGGGIYMVDRNDVQPLPLVQEVEKQTKTLESRMKEESAVLAEKAGEKESSSEPAAVPRRTIASSVVAAKTVRGDSPVVFEQRDVIQMKELERDTEPVEEVKSEVDDVDVDPQPLRSVTARALPADVVEKTTQAKEKKPRKWGFGMGAGSLSLGTDNVVAQYVTQSTALRAENLLVMNNKATDGESVRGLPKTDVDHKMPLSFGLGVSRMLNNRLALQSGITYTYLQSEWQTNGTIYGKTKQGLHFIGIPLSLTYLFAEWGGFDFYGTAGVMGEVNVAGRLSTQLIAGDEEKGKIKEDIRMKKPMWSLNARIGVSYPLISFLNAYAEGGAGYYFDNGSDIETIRSEKPFNVGFQVGLRLGF